MSQYSEYEMLLQEERELSQRIHELMGDANFFPDESISEIHEWVPENETQVLWDYRIQGEIGKLEARRRKINRKLGALKRRKHPILQARC